jgi:exoribonuclease R
VFVQQLDGMSQFFSISGKWAHSNLATVSFAVPGYIDPALVQPLLPFLPTDPTASVPKGDVNVPRQVAAPVLKVLEDLTRKADDVYRANAPVLDTAYANLADPTRIRMMTLQQIATALLGRSDAEWSPSPEILLAVRKSLLHSEYRFFMDKRSHRMTNVFAIRSSHDVKNVELVHEWIRDHREHLAVSSSEISRQPGKRGEGVKFVADFINKARRLIATSRKDREPNLGNLGPSKARFSLGLGNRSSAVRPVFGERFNSADKKIIEFIRAWALHGQFDNIPGFHATSTSLIMATGCYEVGTIQHRPAVKDDQDRIERSTGALFLQEIGVTLPYENLAVYDEQLMLPTVRSSRNLEFLNKKADELKEKPDFKDSMADMRRDWGSTTVYCIDDAGAHEIDDGISIERVKNKDSEFWCHVHVANPTAFFGKTHVLTGLAAHMGETIYTPERVYPMLPLWAAERYFSIDRNRPVITFSSRVDSTGKVLENKIQHGIVRKVVSITPSELSAVLGEKNTLEKKSIVVGGEVPAMAKRSPPKLDSNQVLELQDMYAVARNLWERRKAAGAISITGDFPSVRVYENSKGPGLAWNPPSVDASRLIQGDPIIELSNNVRTRCINLDINATKIVEEMMMLGGQTAASWCTERNIPVMYRGTVETPDDTPGMTAQEFEEEIIKPYMEKHGDLSRILASRYMASRGRAVAHFSPLPHKIMGVTGYVKVTSPLRRFSDMMTHWQIEAAIRYEARTGRKLDAAQVDITESGLPFSQRQMQESIVTLQPKEKLIRQVKRDSALYWFHLALMRAFHYKETELPPTFQCWINHVPVRSLSRATAVGNLVDYNLQVKLTEDVDAQLGDEWEVAIDSVDYYQRKIFVKPLRLLFREADLVLR